MKTCIIVGAGGRGKDSYAPYIKKHNLMKIVGVAEADELKRTEFCRDYGISQDMAFSDYRELFAKGKLADAVLICTQDRMHLKPALMAIECGYHILLEKPISPIAEEIEILQKAVQGYDKVFMTGFVLRYTPFIIKIKELLDSGEIGRIINMQLNENEGYWHHAHSYVRGPWNNDKTSAPLIVAKSCHDFDLMLYLINSRCTHIASYGSNTYFTQDNAPGDVPERCTDLCPFADTCMYNAVKLYTDGPASYFVHKFECGYEKENIINALKTNPYGRCIYRCDNNVCDHQVAALEFENGVCAVFTVSAFSLNNTRTIKLMGTKGEIGGCMEDGKIVLKKFGENSEQAFHVTHDNSKHCGGDGGLMKYFTSAIEDENTAVDTRIFEAHRLAFEAERLRQLNRK